MAIIGIEAGLEKESTNLEHMEGSAYKGHLTAKEEPIKTDAPVSHKTLTVRVQDDAGNTTEERRDVEVHNDTVFPMLPIITDRHREDIGYADGIRLDLEVGDTNDFELNTDIRSEIDYGAILYIPGTEYGGLLEDREVSTKKQEITWTGYTFRGLLTQKIVEPPRGEDYLVLNGEINTVLKGLIGEQFGNLFTVEEANTGITLKNWKVDRYATLYDAIMKILEAHNLRLQIQAEKPEGNEHVTVHLKAVPVMDYSDYITYSQDYNIDFTIRDYRRGINHLICAGKGQNEERIVVHLYVQKDGGIGKSKYYQGLDERTALYDFSSADLEKLEEDGVKRLKELMNYKEVNVEVKDADLELGDIIGGYEQITGTEVKKPIVRKILKIEDGEAKIEYKVKGDD